MIFGLILALHLYWLFALFPLLVAMHVFRARREAKVLQESSDKATSITATKLGSDPAKSFHEKAG